MRQLNKKEKQKKTKRKLHRYLVSPTGVLLLGFFDLLKVSKITTKFFTCSKSVKILRRSHARSSHPKRMTYDLFKVSKMTNFNYDLFKVAKWLILFMTCSKSPK